MAYNSKDRNAEQYQPGGVAMFSVGKIAHRVVEQGKDPSNLGRWVYVRYRGKHDRTFRVVTVYI